MENLLNKDSVKRVKEFIEKFDPQLNVMVLETTARTAQEAANSLHCEVGAIVKSSLNKLKKILKKKDVSMANADEVKKNTGFSIGGVAPVAHSRSLDVIVDKSLNRFKFVFAAAGHPNCVFKVTYDKLIKITKGLVKEITE